MQKFTSCFVGIPLPDDFQNRFEDILNKIRKLYPSWEIVYPKTPHLTVFYLNEQSQNVLPAIKRLVEKEVGIVKNLVLTVKGFNYFSKEDERYGIIFLEILNSPVLKEFNKHVSSKLNNYYASDNNLTFHPHLTVARAEFNRASILRDTVKNLNSKIVNIKWIFPVTEVAIYGVNSARQSQHQEKIITISVR